MQEKTTLTTGEIAKHCGVNFRTVIRWIKRGDLKAFQLPGRGDNRVTVSDFFDFLKKNQMPIPNEFKHLERRILIVDDDIKLARSIQRVLRRANFETALATDGFQAGSMLESLIPSAMTLDLQMPGLPGLDVINFVRSREAFDHIKILVVSAMPQTQLEEALAAGADDVLEKPFENKTLVEKISALIDA